MNRSRHGGSRSHERFIGRRAMHSMSGGMLDAMQDILFDSKITSSGSSVGSVNVASASPLSVMPGGGLEFKAATNANNSNYVWTFPVDIPADKDILMVDGTPNTNPVEVKFKWGQSTPLGNSGTLSLFNATVGPLIQLRHDEYKSGQQNHHAGVDITTDLTSTKLYRIVLPKDPPLDDAQVLGVSSNGILSSGDAGFTNFPDTVQNAQAKIIKLDWKTVTAGSSNSSATNVFTLGTPNPLTIRNDLAGDTGQTRIVMDQNSIIDYTWFLPGITPAEPQNAVLSMVDKNANNEINLVWKEAAESWCVTQPHTVTLLENQKQTLGISQPTVATKAGTTTRVQIDTNNIQFSLGTISITHPGIYRAELFAQAGLLANGATILVEIEDTSGSSLPAYSSLVLTNQGNDNGPHVARLVAYCQFNSAVVINNQIKFSATLSSNGGNSCNLYSVTTEVRRIK